MFRDEQNGGTIVDKILKEISETLGDGVAFEDVPHEDAFKFLTREMPYLNATVRETLRLHPSVPKNIKFSKSEDTLPDGTIVPADGSKSEHLGQGREAISTESMV